MASLIQTEPIETLHGLEALRDEWDRLLLTCPSATPFQHPEWLIPWWRHLGQGRLRVLVMRMAGRLCGLAPLYEKDAELTFLGSGVSDYLDLILDPSVELLGTEVFLGYLAEMDGWGTCRLEELRPGSPLLGVRAPHGLRAECLAGEVCLRGKLPATVDEFRKLHPMSGACGSKRLFRKLNKRGLKVQAAESQNDVSAAMGALFRLHAKRWASVGQTGVLQGAGMRAFHEEAAQGFFRKGMMALLTIIVDGQEVAALYGFESRGTFYAYLTGYDPEFSRLSPGKLVLLSAAERCIERGVEVFDLMRGSEKYKYDWDPVESRNSTLIIKNEKKSRRNL